MTNALHAAPSDVETLLAPRSVAVIGASEDLTKFGGRLYNFLVQHGYDGAIYPINPKRESLLGIKAYPSIDKTPTPPDMAVMAVPRDSVKAAVQACADAGTKAAIIITAQFSDAGDEGAALEREIVEVARAGGMRLIGPNCLGLISPVNKLVLCASPALYVDKLPLGRIGMVSQSGALMATIFDRAQTRGIGFSHCFSIGNQADLDLCDFMDFLIADPTTEVICTYIEGVKNAERFLAAARRAHAAGKPVLAVKAGRTEFGAAAAFSHTASLAGSYEAFATACRETGITLLDDTDAMIMLAACLAEFPRTKTAETAILTTSGGGGAITADRLTDHGVSVAEFSEGTVAALAGMFSAQKAKANPIDMGASNVGGSVAVAETAMRALMKDEEVGFVLAPITTAPDVRLICAGIVDGAEAARAEGKERPHLIVLQPGQAGDAARAMLRERGWFYSDSLDEAVRVVAGYRQFLNLAPRETPARPADLPAPKPMRAGAYGEEEAKRALASYGVPVNRGEVAADAAGAEAAARRMDAPFVVKVVSDDIVHKSDAGGVALGLETPEAVAGTVARMQVDVAKARPGARIDGWLVQEMKSGKQEMFIGARNDAQFGPMIMVGAGGVLIELLRDVAMASAPVSVAEAREMIAGLKVAPLLAGYRGAGALDVEALAEAISRTSWLVHDLGPGFQARDAKPVLVGEAGEGCVAVDARMLISDAK
ncbi:MAG: acetate--CoA ligase family protein [Pikeienuella sp.]